MVDWDRDSLLVGNDPHLIIRHVFPQTEQELSKQKEDAIRDRLRIIEEVKEHELGQKEKADQLREV